MGYDNFLCNGDKVVLCPHDDCCQLGCVVELLNTNEECESQVNPNIVQKCLDELPEASAPADTPIVLQVVAVRPLHAILWLSWSELLFYQVLLLLRLQLLLFRLGFSLTDLFL